MAEKFKQADVHRLGVVLLRKGAWREFTPSINTEHYYGPNQNIGPITLVFDLHHDQNPKLSKPFAQAHLTPTQVVQLCADLTRAYLKVFPLRTVSDMFSEISAEIPRAAIEHAKTCPVCGRPVGGGTRENSERAKVHE